MATVSVTDAAFAGFRLIRAKPKVIIIWAVLQLVLSFSLSVLSVLAVGPALGQLQSTQSTSGPNPATALKSVQGLVPFYLLMFPLLIAIYGVFYAAINRAVLRPKQEGLAYLQLGMAELRQMAVMVLMMLLFMAIYLAAILALVLIGGTLAAGIGLAAKGSGMFIAPLLLMLGLFGLVGGMIFVAVRLSLAAAQTFDTGRISLFGSWTLTRGHFWTLFGAYLLVGVMMLGMLLIYLLATFAFTFLLGGGLNGFLAMARPDMSSLSAYLSPAALIPVLLSAVFSAIYLPVFFAPAAAIYKSLTARFGVTADGEAASLDEIFS